MTTTVAFIHSTGLGPFMWAPYLGCAGSLPVAAPFNLGYAPHEPLSSRERVSLADDAAHVAQSLRTAGPVHLVAHSWGATIALEMARTRLVDVQSLWLYEPVLFGSLVADEAALDADTATDLRLVVQGFRETSRDLGGTEPWLRAFIDYWNGPGAWDAMSEKAREAMRRVGWKMSQEVRATFEDVAPFEAYRVDVPLTLVTGGRSQRPARAMSRQLAKVNPQAQLHEIEGLAHMSVLDRPDRLGPLLQSHLSHGQRLKD